MVGEPYGWANSHRSRWVGLFLEPSAQGQHHSGGRARRTPHAAGARAKRGNHRGPPPPPQEGQPMCHHATTVADRAGAGVQPTRARPRPTPEPSAQGQHPSGGSIGAPHAAGARAKRGNHRGPPPPPQGGQPMCHHATTVADRAGAGVQPTRARAVRTPPARPRDRRSAVRWAC